MQKPAKRKYDLNWAALERQSGVNKKTIRARLDKGRTLEEALSKEDYRIPYLTQYQRPVTYQWGEFRGLEAIAKHLRVSTVTVRKYMKLYENDFDKVAQAIISSQAARKKQEVKQDGGAESALKFRNSKSPAMSVRPSMSSLWATALGLKTGENQNVCTL